MASQPAGDELLTPGGVAALLFVDPKTVTRWARAGKLNSIRTPGGHRRYLKADVLAIMDGRHCSQDLSRDPPLPPSPRDEPVMGAADGVGAERDLAAAAVVAEAVAIALETEAADAAEAVHVIAGAVAAAAAEAANAAARARGARAFAAAEAAQLMARDAVRAATGVQLRADAAAAQVARAAELAAEGLEVSTTPGNEDEAARIAQHVADTVKAAAAATALDTTRAAASVAGAVAAAADQVARTVSAADDAFEYEVAAAADVVLGLTATVGERLAVGTRARAAGIAMAAREAASALQAPREPHSSHRDDTERSSWVRQRIPPHSP